MGGNDRPGARVRGCRPCRAETNDGLWGGLGSDTSRAKADGGSLVSDSVRTSETVRWRGVVQEEMLVAVAAATARKDDACTGRHQQVGKGEAEPTRRLRLRRAVFLDPGRRGRGGVAVAALVVWNPQTGRRGLAIGGAPSRLVARRQVRERMVAAGTATPWPRGDGRGAMGGRAGRARRGGCVSRCRVGRGNRR